MSGKQNQVISRISEQIAKDPTNKLHYFYLGIAYDALKDNKKAEEAYKKAIELDANYFDATLNLGSGILNNGIDLYNKANTLPVNKQKEYDAAMKIAFIEFDRAFPYLDKAVQIDPKSLNALQNLKTYYVIKKNAAKVAELSKQISALQ
jgi:tetratricopeptide (TPR) repeat protein